MYKLVLVDDEADVREGVTQEIDWVKYGFEVSATAENGQEAIELIERSMPDVVVTDIQMPFMDGLQLSEQIRDKFPAIKIIILTGFDEFEYAQKAVKLHIDEYVLKPFSAKELIQVLEKVRSQLDEEIDQKENIQLLQEHYRQSIPVLRGMFLSSLVTSKLTDAEIDEKSFLYGLNLTGNGFVVSVFRMDLPAEDKPESARETYLRDIQLQLFAIYNIAEEIVKKHHLGIVFIQSNQVVLLTVNDARDRDTVIKKTLTVLEEIRQSIERYLKYSVTIGVGTVSRDIKDVSYSYEEAVLALDYRLILGNNRVICIDDMERRLVEKVRFDELKEHALIRCIKVGTIQEMQDIVEDLFREITNRSVSFQDCQIYLLEILTSILKAAKDANIELIDVVGSGALFTELLKFNNLQEAKSWIIRSCISLMSSIASDRQSAYKRLVDQAKEYTKTHYHESDISIHKVCSYLHISTGYFSSIFKKEANMTFVNYLLQIRMESAKELLRTTDLKTFEIAEQVGYADANYFSFCFRKHFGLSPKEYRNSSRGV